MSDSADFLPRDRYIPTGELLGEGGMAKVWRVWHRDRGVWCAVKILRARYASIHSQRRRFLNEAHILMRLRHRNVIAALEVSEGELPFLVMEVADGGNLNQWVHRCGPMPAQMAVGVAIQICKGLSAAHKIGVVHRDVKPHNVLINRKGVCKISDFGIARLPRADGSADIPDATVQGSDAMGTLGYMAPEQRSDPRRADPRTDVYGIAATLVDLLTGRPQMNLFMAGQDPSMLADVPEVLRTVIMKGAEYEPANRFPEVRDLALALYELRDQLPPAASGTPGLADGLPPEPPPPAGTLQSLESADGRLDDLEVPTFVIRTASHLERENEGSVATPATTADPARGQRTGVGPRPSPSSAQGAPVGVLPAPPTWVPPTDGVHPPRATLAAAGSAADSVAPVQRVRHPSGDDIRRNAPRTPDSSIGTRSPSGHGPSRMARPITFEPDDLLPRRSIRWWIASLWGAGVLLAFWWMWWWVSSAEAHADRGQQAFEAVLVAEGPVVDQLVELGVARGALGGAHDAVTQTANPVELAHLVPTYLRALDHAREQVHQARSRELVEVDRRIKALHEGGEAFLVEYREWSRRCDHLAGRIADLIGARCPASVAGSPANGP